MGTRPTRVFAQLVDDSTGIVLGKQITPIGVSLDGATHALTVPLEDIAFTAYAGAHVTLQLVANATAYASSRLGTAYRYVRTRFTRFARHWRVPGPPHLRGGPDRTFPRPVLTNPRLGDP